MIKTQVKGSILIQTACFTSREMPAVGQVYDSILLHYSPDDIAKQLALVDRGLMIRISFDELLQHMNTTTVEQVTIT